MQTTGKRCQTRNRPILKAYNPELKQVIFFRPRCKLWSCPVCAEINKGLWVVRAYQGVEKLIEQGQQITMLTLTSHENLNAAGTLRVWPKAWKRLHARANRAGGKGIYLMVPEQHKDGRLHMHAIATWNLGNRFWKDKGRECGLGFMAEEEIARTPEGAAGYVSKYVSKQLGLDSWPRGFRHVRTSRDWPSLVRLELPEGWHFSPLERQDCLMSEIVRHAAFFDTVRLLDHRAAWSAIAAIDNDGVVVD